MRSATHSRADGNSMRPTLAMRIDWDPPIAKPVPLDPVAKEKLQAVTARMPRPKVAIPEAINVEGAIFDSWRRRAAGNDDCIPPRPPAFTSRVRTTAAVSSHSPRSPLMEQHRTIKDALLKSLPSPATTIQRSNFHRRLELPLLGVHLLVDEPKSDYVPHRPRHDSHRHSDTSRNNRVELSRFLFGDRRDALESDRRLTSKPNDETPVEDEVSIADHVAEAARTSLEALAQLPPGVMESTPYLRHVRDRAEYELHISQAVLDTAEETRMFNAFTEYLAKQGIDQRAALHDVDAMKETLAEFVKTFKRKKLRGLEEDGTAMAPVEEIAGTPETMNPLQDDATTMPTMKDAIPASIEKPKLRRDPSSQLRPHSAKFKLSIQEKRVFLTELVERSRTSLTVSPVAMDAVDAPSSTSPVPPMGSAARPPSVHDIHGPAIVPATVTVARRIEKLQRPYSAKKDAVCLLAVEKLNKQNMVLRQRREISQQRFNNRIAKSTDVLHHRYASSSRSIDEHQARGLVPLCINVDHNENTMPV